MARARLTYLSADDTEFVHEQALRVLAEVGVGYNTPEAIDLLAEAGAQVDRERLTARVPQELVERCLATCPSEVRLAGRDPRHDVVVGDGSLTFCADGTATYVLDDLTGRREDGSAEWLRRTMRLYDALPEVDYAWPTISARDLDPLTAGLEIEAISLANLTKHVQDEVRDPAHAAPLVEIFEAVAGGSLWDRPVFSTIDCTVAPLQHEREMTQATLAMVRAGVPLLALPMPLSGTTAPMTVLGTMIVNVAELLSAVVLFQLAQPGCGIISGMGAGVADMRSGLYLCGTPECALMNVIGIEMSRFYGLPCTGSAITCDAKASNQQAGAEGMLTGAACALAGADTILAFGCSDGAQSLSFAKVLLDCDSVGALRRLVREDPIDATRALLDDIAAVGIGGHYLGRKSTRRFHHGGEVWQPALWQRGPFEAYEGRPLVAEAAARAEELLRTHVVEPLPEDVAAEVGAVIDRYARSVGAPAGRVSWNGGHRMSEIGGGRSSSGRWRTWRRCAGWAWPAGSRTTATAKRASSRRGAPATATSSSAPSRSSGARAWTCPTGSPWPRATGAAASPRRCTPRSRARRARAASRRLWVTARAPVFFVAQGFAPAPPGRERDILLGGCLDCVQFGTECEPKALTKRLDDTDRHDP